MTKEIPLTQGKVAIVDDEDYERISQFKWYAQASGRNWRACRRSGKKETAYMHHMVLSVPDGVLVDHINRDSLDNRRENLRACSQKENLRNCGISSANASGFKGVSWNVLRGKWRAQIVVDRKAIHLGLFNSPEDAARAYDDAAKKYFGEFAYLNFPNETHE